MTQLSLIDLRLERLHACTKPGSKARYLGEWMLDHPQGVTTAELAEWGRNHLCSSVMERLRLDLRKRCQWNIEAIDLPGRSSRLYVVREGLRVAA